MSIQHIEQRLRNRIGTQNLIGCFTYEKGLPCFCDIRGGQGDVVKHPRSQDLSYSIPYKGSKKLTEGKFYSFNWHIEDEGLMNFVIDGEPTEINNDEFVNGIFNARLNLSGSNLELFNNFQKTIFNEVTGAQHTYIYELLQNANDYPYNDEHVSVKFILTDHYLFFMHSGDYFNLRNVVGISSINQGEKRSNTKTIGYKGIGFKTVFVNNEYVYLRSGEWSLRFDRKYSEREFAGDCPWALMPIATQLSDIDSEAQTILREYPMRVQFALKHKSDARLNKPQLDKVFCNDRILLFIPNVYSVDVIEHGKIAHSIVKDDDKWIVETLQYTIPESLKSWVEDNINAGDKIPEKFKEIENVGISFAVTKDGKRLIPVDDAVVFNYLPTELRLGLNFLLNADFVPNANRGGLHDVVWNDHIMEQCGVLFADWWASLLQEEGKYDISSVFDILPDSLTSNDKYSKIFLTGFKNRIQKIPCVPTLKDGYHLEPIKNIVLDKTGIIASPSPIFTDEEFYLFSDTNGSLPHPDIRCHHKLLLLLSEFDPHKFNGMSLDEMCTDGDFIKWLDNTDNDINFISFLIQSDFLNNLTERRIFLMENGGVEKSNKIYYDLDKYFKDIHFLSSDLPRLNTEVRKALEEKFDTKWKGNESRFKRFEPFRFANNILSHISSYSKVFEEKANSIRFIHFLAISHHSTSLPETFPLYTTDNIKISGSYEALFLSSNIGEQIAQRQWVDKKWFNFIADEYFERDGDDVKNFFRNKADISELTTTKILRSYVGVETYAQVISEKIKNQANSIDFYSYLSDVQEDFTNWSGNLRKLYTIFTTDGESTNSTSVSQVIFRNDEDWKQIASLSWMPANLCLAISPIYYANIDNEKKERLNEFFKSQQIVQTISMNGFAQPLFSRIADVVAKLTSKELSKEFLNFLFENHAQLFKNENNYATCKTLPIFCKGQEQSLAISSSIYQYSTDLLDLYNQPWFNKSSVNVCDDYYESLFDGTDRKTFFNKLGIKSFDLIDFIRKVLLPNLSSLNEMLQTFENNLSFHHYFANLNERLSAKDCEPIKALPIFISTPTGVPGLVKQSQDHYLPSELLTEIIGKELVPISILDSLHPSYIRTDADRKYFEEKLGNVEIDAEGFFDYISQNEEEVIPYLKEDDDRNIRFWRWAAKQKLSADTSNALSSFPLLSFSSDNTDEIYKPANELYITGIYTDLEGIEKFVAQYVDSPYFVSPRYKFEDELSWKSLFRAVGVTTDFHKIIFNNILPNLQDFKDVAIVKILSGYTTELNAQLQQNPGGKIQKQLNSLQLLCADENYRTPEQVVVAGRYFSYAENPLEAIVLNNLVSDTYIETVSNDEERRKIINFIKFIADNFSEKCETATELRDKKFSYFVDHQAHFSLSENHFLIIRQIANAYYNDIEGFGHLVESSKIQLKATDNQLLPSNQLYLSSIYNPDCDYAANGITSLKYVNDSYFDGTSHIFNFFTRPLNVKHTFNSSNLNLLANRTFAIYFWETYAPNHEPQLKQICTEANLKDLVCMPTETSICKPRELYDYRNKDLYTIIKRLGRESATLPAIKLPDWMYATPIGFRGRLFLRDCIDYLKLDSVNYRREVLNWIVKTPTDVISNHREQIRSYIETANWLNGKKEWVPLKGLVALEWENATLKDNFSGNVAVCSPSYMPEFKEDYETLCRVFEIPILTNSDFQKEKVGECYVEEDFVSNLRKKLIYLAWKSSKSGDWKERLETYISVIEEADICSCESISYFYNDVIKTDLQTYTETPEALWYVGSWNGPMFLAIVTWIKTHIIGRSEFDTNFLQKLFLIDFTKFVENQEGGKLPAEVLEMLSEDERRQIKEDELAHAATFNEDDISNAELPNAAIPNSSEHVGVPSTIDETTNMQISDDIDSNEDDDEQETKTVAVNEQKTQSASTPRHATSPRSSSPTSTSSQSRQKQDTNTTNNTPARKPESALDKFKDRVNKERERSVGRPHSSGRSGSTFGGEMPSTPKTEDETKKPFFSDSDNASRTSSQSNQPSNSHFQQDFKKRNSEAQTAALQAADTADLYDEFLRTPKYSFLWFELLIDLQTDKEKQQNSRRTCDISFRESELLIENNGIATVRLKNPNSLIPSWIEFSDFAEVSCISTNSVQIKSSIISHDESSVDIQIDAEDVAKFNKVKKIRLWAENRTNIIDSLNTRFYQLGYEDNFNLADNLPKDIKFVYGPPGTGKTTRLVELLHNIIKESGADRRDILVLTPTNKAADVIAEKLSNDELCFDYLSRFGSSESKSLIEDKAVVMTRDTMEIDFFEKNIMVTTAARYSYDCMQPDDIAICDHDWDYIIIDEASMIDLVTITYVLHKAKNAKFIVAGDPKQIQPPNSNNDFPSENIYSMVGLDEFKDAMHYDRFEVETLDVQHRSTAIIGNLVSQFAYNGMLKNDENRAPQKPISIDGVDAKDINFVAFRIEELDRLYGRTAINESAFHLYSAIFTYNMVGYVAKQLEKNNPETEYTIGVVCPYKAQAEAISQLIENRSLDTANCTVHYGTVHKFQGDECDIMFVILNPPQNVSSGSHINNQNIINVAMSRARDYIFFVIPDKSIPGFKVREILGNLAETKYRSILYCKDIERTIFGNENFIFENTNVMSHMPVNVYYETFAKYEVRIDDHTLDIQINE